MGEKSWQRARSEDQIEERVNAILEAAAVLFRSEPYEKVSVLTIAKKAEFTRSNVYRYFSTKEEIFLALYMADLNAWGERISREFVRELGIEEFAETWVRILLDQRRLLDLSPLLASTLEKNSSEEVYRRTKLLFSEGSAAVTAAVAKALPSYDPEAIFDFLMMQQALAAGAWPMAQTTEMQKRVLEDLNLQRMCVDFPEFFRKAIVTFLRGLVSDH